MRLWRVEFAKTKVWQRGFMAFGQVEIHFGPSNAPKKGIREREAA